MWSWVSWNLELGELVFELGGLVFELSELVLGLNLLELACASSALFPL